MASAAALQQFSSETRLPITEHPWGSKQYLIQSGSSYAAIKKKVDEFNRRNGTDITCWNDRSKDATFIK